MNNNSNINKTIEELSTEYMQEYHCALSNLGQENQKTQLNFACWQVFKEAINDIRRIKYPVGITQPVKRKSLSDLIVGAVKYCIKIFYR